MSEGLTSIPGTGPIAVSRQPVARPTHNNNLEQEYALPTLHHSNPNSTGQAYSAAANHNKLSKPNRQYSGFSPQIRYKRSRRYLLSITRLRVRVGGCLGIRTRVRRRTRVGIYLGPEVEVEVEVEAEWVGGCSGIRRISSSNSSLQPVVVFLVVPILLNNQLMVVVYWVIPPTRNSQLRVAIFLEAYDNTTTSCRWRRSFGALQPGSSQLRVAVFLEALQPRSSQLQAGVR